MQRRTNKKSGRHSSGRYNSVRRRSVPRRPQNRRYKKRKLNKKKVVAVIGLFILIVLLIRKGTKHNKAVEVLITLQILQQKRFKQIQLKIIKQKINQWKQQKRKLTIGD